MKIIKESKNLFKFNSVNESEKNYYKIATRRSDGSWSYVTNQSGDALLFASKEKADEYIRSKFEGDINKYRAVKNLYVSHNDYYTNYRLEEDVMKKFRFEFIVDGIKSADTVSAVNMAKAQELIQKKYNGQTISYTKKEEVKDGTANESLEEGLDIVELKQLVNLCQKYGVETSGALERIVKYYNAKNPMDAILSVSDEVGDDFTMQDNTPFNFSEDLTTDNGTLNNDLDDEFTSGAEYIQGEEKTSSGYTGPELGKDTGISAIINALIRDEWEAIDGYESALATIGTDERYSQMVGVLTDISNEEHTHIGQLQELLKTISPNVAEIENGKDEAEEQIAKSETISQDITGNATTPTFALKPTFQPLVVETMTPAYLRKGEPNMNSQASAGNDLEDVVACSNIDDEF